MPSNIDIVRRFYESLRYNDKSYLDMCSDDIEWIVMKNMPNGGTFIGKSAVFDEYFPNMLRNFSEFSALTEEFFDAGQNVIVTGRYVGTGNTGKKFDVPFAHIYTITNSKIIKFRQYTDATIIKDAIRP
jgi:uncharacterized protein